MSKLFSPRRNTLIHLFYKAYLKQKCKSVENFIFVATTGRSGTASLSRTMSQLEACVSCHEPDPIMNNEILRERNNNNLLPAEKLYRSQKSKNIRKAAIGHKIYVETNHMFVKTFIDLAISDFGQKLKIIHLVRDPVLVAKSLVDLDHYPGTHIGDWWYLNHHAPGNYIKLGHCFEEGSEFNHPFYKALWYWYEIEARVEYWKKQYPDTQFIDFYTEDLNDACKLMMLLDALEVKYDRSTFSVPDDSAIENRKTEFKTVSSIETGDENKMHESFKALLIESGYQLPYTVERYS